MPQKSDREYRNMTVRALEDGQPEGEKEYTVTGYATTFEEPYILYSDEEITIREVVDAHAFDNADMSDVIMQYDHTGRVFARNKNGTLKTEPDEKGLYIEADLSGTDIGRQLFEEIRGGYTDKMSFGFTVTGETWERVTDEDGHTESLRRITEIDKLFDVSAVSIPANDATSISARNLVDGVIDEIRAERREAEKIALERKRTEVRAKALKGMNK